MEGYHSILAECPFSLLFFLMPLQSSCMRMSQWCLHSCVKDLDTCRYLDLVLFVFFFCPMVSTQFNCELVRKDPNPQLSPKYSVAGRSLFECSCNGQRQGDLQVKLKHCMAYAEI